MRLIDVDKFKQRIKNSTASKPTKVASLVLADTQEIIDPVHAANTCYCKECQYYKPFRDYPDCSKILQYGYCYYWNYEEGESPNEVEEKDFCSRGVPKNVQM